MGKQIVKQPNGLYAVWSSVVDDFVLLDATPDDIVNESVNEYRQQMATNVLRVIQELDAGHKPYCQFQKTWQECLDDIKELHGPDAESLKLAASSG